MADSNLENIHEDEGMDVEEGEEFEENGESALSLRPDVPFFTGLNLVLLVSYLSLSSEECSNFEDTENIETTHTEEPKDNVLKLRAEKRKLHEPKLVEPRTQRFQTKVRDCRTYIETVMPGTTEECESKALFIQVRENMSINGTFQSLLGVHQNIKNKALPSRHLDLVVKNRDN